MMVNWLCPKPEAPSGGVMFIHRFAYLLSQLGIESKVIQQKPFEVWWDATPVPKEIYAGRDIQGALAGDNMTIIPEPMWHNEFRQWPNPIMLCQNWIWLDKRLPLGDAKIIVCSRHLANYIQRNYNGGRVIGIIHPYVADGVFVREDEHRVANRVLIINRRNDLGVKLRAILEELKFEVVMSTGNVSQTTLASNLARSDYYAHLISPEGWPQICVEAMRSGAVVVGTTGGSGNEFMFHTETAMVAQDSVYGYNVTDDIMLNQIAEHLFKLREEMAKKESIRNKAYEWSARYNCELTLAELGKVFGAPC